ncbi:hypothetical protein AEQU2_02683 [Aequorivita lipolytica]|nr:hypothetical protein AEQU2_02683 [Aequorivita lipolytica]
MALSYLYQLSLSGGSWDAKNFSIGISLKKIFEIYILIETLKSLIFDIRSSSLNKYI